MNWSFDLPYTIENNEGALGQVHLDHLVTTLPQLSHLTTWCPFPNNASLKLLTNLTKLNYDLFGVPAQLRSLTEQNFFLPSSLQSLIVNHTYSFKASSWISNVKPLTNLTQLNIRAASSFAIGDFIEFVTALPKQLTQLVVADFLSVATPTEREEDGPAPVISIKLPKLTELRCHDTVFTQVPVFLEFSQRPRLRHLDFKGTSAQTERLLNSLSKYPGAAECSFSLRSHHPSLDLTKIFSL